jgi:purine-binding chemotaxis protein CheW
MEKITASSLMPKTQNELQVLNQRAEHYSIKQEEEKIHEHETTYVRFRLGENEHYGIPYKYIREVMNNVVVTSVPCVPDYIAGVINRRSVLITILDLNVLIYGYSHEHGENASIIILVVNGMTIGILTDGIEGSHAYHEDSLSPPIPSEHIKKMDYVLGLHNGNTTIMNMDLILSDIELKGQP